MSGCKNTNKGVDTKSQNEDRQERTKTKKKRKKDKKDDDRKIEGTVSINLPRLLETVSLLIGILKTVALWLALTLVKCPFLPTPPPRIE